MENTTLAGRYGSAENFLRTFCPERQAAFTADVRRAFMGAAPTLRQVAAEYGGDVAKAWVACQVRDLALFAGASKVTTGQIASIAEVVVAMHARLRVTELMYFFLHLKGGEWGNYYGLGNGLQVTTALNAFLATRVRILDRLEREDRERREREQAAGGRRGCTYEEYLAWRRANGMGEPDLPFLRGGASGADAGVSRASGGGVGMAQASGGGVGMDQASGAVVGGSRASGAVASGEGGAA